MKYLKSVSCQRVMHAASIIESPPCSEATAPWPFPSKFDPAFVALCEITQSKIIE